MSEREEFIALIRKHPELIEAVKAILTGQEPVSDAQDLHCPKD